MNDLKECPRCGKHTNPVVMSNNGQEETFYRCEHCKWKMGKVTA